MADANTTKTSRLPGGIMYDPELSGASLLDDGFAVLGCATNQLKLIADLMAESDGSGYGDQTLAMSLYGTAWLMDIAHDMLFEGSERSDRGGSHEQP